MKALNCPNCGAALPAHSAKSEVAVCEFCGTSIRLPQTPSIEPLLEADGGSLSGWDLLNEQHLTVSTTDPVELRGMFVPKASGAYYLLRSTKLLSDFDIQTDIMFTGGAKEKVRAGLYLRFSDAGGYAFLISAQASHTYGYFEKQKDRSFLWQPMQPWTQSSALNIGFDRLNRLRVVCKGNSLQVYLNDMLADSFTDSRFTSGRAYVAVDPGEDENEKQGGFAVSGIRLRELPGV